MIIHNSEEVESTYEPEEKKYRLNFEIDQSRMKMIGTPNLEFLQIPSFSNMRSSTS